MKLAVWLPLLLLLVAYPLLSHLAIGNRWVASWLFYVPPVLIYLVLLTTFGITLRHGREPLIARFARMEQGPLTAELSGYTRALTQLWCVFFAVMATISVGLAWWTSLSLWSLFTHLISYLLLGALFAGEYAYRRKRFPQYQHASLWQLIRNIRAGGLR